MLRTALLAGAALLSCAANAGAFPPGGNTGALARGFALPALGNAVVLAGGRSETGALLDFTSEFVVEGTCATECIRLDGETARLLLSHRRGLGAGWDFSIEVPLLSQGGGFLDSWIEEWHDWFGLPNGGREAAPRDQYEYRYDDSNSVTRLNVTEPYSGFGDITLGIGRHMGDRVALRGMVKLPTGDDLRLGGGNAGAALWFDASLPMPAGFQGFLAAGMSFNDRGAVLPDMQNREAVFGGIGLTTPFPFTDRVRILAQLYGHSRLYDGGRVSALSRAGVPLTLGLQVRTGPASRFEFGFLEDLAVNASPDFTAYLALIYAPH